METVFFYSSSVFYFLFFNLKQIANCSSQIAALLPLECNVGELWSTIFASHLRKPNTILKEKYNNLANVLICIIRYDV